MQALHLEAAIPRDILTAARTAHGLFTRHGTYNCYIFGYIGSCNYRFKCSPNNTHDTTTSTHNTLGYLVRMEANTMRW